MLRAHYLYTEKNLELGVKYFNQSINHCEKYTDELANFLIHQNKEGIGRALYRLGGNKKGGEKYLNQAREFYDSTDDEYSISELDKFVKTVS